MKQNMQAMDDMGKYFSGTFAAIIIFHFLIYIINATDTVKLATLQDAISALGIALPLAYATLGFGLVIHFFAGVLHGKVSNFQIGGQVAQIVEEKRENGIFVFFVRNLVQVAAVAAMVYFFVEVANLNDALVDFASANIIEVALVALTVIFMIIMIKHATAPTEFNLYGMRGSGMKNYRIFALLAFITSGALVALPLISGGSFTIDSCVYVAGIAFVAFLLDCIIKPRVKKDKKKKNQEEEDEEYSEDYFNPVAPMAQPVEADKKGKKEVVQAPAQPYPYPPVYPPVVQPQVQVKQPVQRSVYQQTPVYPQNPNYPQIIQQTSSQPVYIPIYYPMPQQQNNNACMRQAPCCSMNACPVQAKALPCTAAPAVCEETKKPAPAPAPTAEEPSALENSLASKKEAKLTRKDLKTRKKSLKLAKKEAKKAAKIAKKNAKIEKKLNKEELNLKKKQAKFAKKQVKVAKKQEQKAKPVVVETPVVAPVVEQPAPAAIEEDVKLGVVTLNQEVLPQIEPDEIKGEKPLDPSKQWKVRCPKCGKLLLVREVSPYHRCPSCDKVFEIRKFETYTKQAKSNK